MMIQIYSSVGFDHLLLLLADGLCDGLQFEQCYRLFPYNIWTEDMIVGPHYLPNVCKGCLCATRDG